MLNSCPECDGNVSSDADACPHCGYRVRGREHLLECPSCQNLVIPVVNPHDTLSRHCPLCNKPMTNRGCRTASITGGVIVVLIFFALFLALIIGGFSLITNFLSTSDTETPTPPAIPAPASPSETSAEDQ